MSATQFLQVILIRGDTLQRLRAVTDLKVSESNNTVRLRGRGGFFPEVRGDDWCAVCRPWPEHDSRRPDDIRPVLDFLMSESVRVTSNATRQEIEDLLRGAL